MNKDIDNFRVMIVLAAFTMALALFVTYKAPPPPADLQDMYGWWGYGAATPGVLDERFWYVWLAFTFVGLLGSFFFINSARYILLVPLLLDPIRTGLGGIWVSYPLQDAFWSFHNIFSTFVIGMALFYEPVACRFRRSASTRLREPRDE